MGVDELLRSFYASYNSGDVTHAMRLVARPPAFQWYSESPDRVSGARYSPYDYDSLADFLGARHRAGATVKVQDVSFAGVSHGLGNFSFYALRNGVRVISKGAVTCSAARFVVLSLGPRPGPTGA